MLRPEVLAEEPVVLPLLALLLALLLADTFRLLAATALVLHVTSTAPRS